MKRTPVHDDDGMDEETAAQLAARDWACPNCEVQNIVILTSNRGRVYAACRTCAAFDDGRTPTQRAEYEARVAQERIERERRKEEQLREARRLEEERVAQERRDRSAPTCVHCGEIERLHNGRDHRFAGSRLDHLLADAVNLLLIAAIVAAFWLFWMSAMNPDAPLHAITAPLLCMWDWKGTICQ